MEQYLKEAQEFVKELEAYVKTDISSTFTVDFEITEIDESVYVRCLNNGKAIMLLCFGSYYPEMNIDYAKGMLKGFYRGSRNVK